jgi:hypothetical protein
LILHDANVVEKARQVQPDYGDMSYRAGAGASAAGFHGTVHIHAFAGSRLIGAFICFADLTRQGRYGIMRHK